MTEKQKQKQEAIDLLRSRYEGKAEAVADIDPRLREYFDDLLVHSSADADDSNDHHNVYEILGAVKFLRMLDAYTFNKRKVQTVIRLREGEWERDNAGRWRYVSGGLKCPGTSGAQVYRWQPFQVFVLASVFGFYNWINTQVPSVDKPELLPTERDRDGMVWDYRRVCTDFTYFGPRKTDKTGLAAYIQFVFFFFEDDNSEIYCCANSSDQAKLLYSRTRQLIAQMDNGNRIRSTQTVTDWRQAYKSVHDSSVRPLSAGGKTKDGMFAQLCCADEFGSAAYTNGKSDMLSLVNVIQSSMGPRREPMTFTTTTAGTIQTGPFIEKLDALHRLLERELTGDTAFEDDRRLCLCLEPDEWERDEESILTKPSIRKKVNPMLGIIVQHASYDGWVAEARSDQTKIPELLAKYFNIYQSGKVTEWIKPEDVRALQIPRRIDDCTWDDGWDVYAAFDFSHGDDFDAVTFLAYNRGTREYFADCDAWVNREAFLKSPYRPLYEQWEKDGWLHVSGEKVVEPEAPIRRIMELDGKGLNFLAFGYDSYQSKEPILLLKEWLINTIGMDAEKLVVPVSQTFANYNASVQKIDYCMAGVVPLHFSESPLWPFEFGNCMLAVDARMENKKPLKRGDNAKVDNVQCLCSCFNLEEMYNIKS